MQIAYADVDAETEAEAEAEAEADRAILANINRLSSAATAVSQPWDLHLTSAAWNAKTQIQLSVASDYQTESELEQPRFVASGVSAAYARRRSPASLSV